MNEEMDEGMRDDGDDDDCSSSLDTGTCKVSEGGWIKLSGAEPGTRARAATYVLVMRKGSAYDKMMRGVTDGASNTFFIN